MITCTVFGCTRQHFGRGLCQRHYHEERKHGAETLPPRANIEARLPEVEKLARRRRVTDRGCWEWTGGTNHIGYGVVTVRYRRYSPHRLSYQLAAGPIPYGMVIDHLCRNTLCFNPGHLEPVTMAENIRRSPLVGAKSHCVYGHEYTEENTYITPAGARHCRECSRRRGRELRARRRANREATS